VISICIPTYNFNINSLVEALLAQMDTGDEIIVIDDASNEATKQNNATIANKVTRFIELPQNVGRAKIRNLFVNEATNEYLLFLDCDSLVQSPQFLFNYKTAIQLNPKVVCGGRVYAAVCPSPNQSLSWKYGTLVESKSVEERKKHPNQSFMTNNFLVHKQVLLQHPFDERLTQYGHEDTLFGLMLKNNRIAIEHINNPVLNGDVETNAVYIQKTENAIENLHLILQFYPSSDLLESINLLKVANKLHFFKTIGFLKLGYFLFGNRLKTKMIHSKNPQLRLFSLYKLLFFSK
jgi:glycosyltransferase involved in cell wall biosynthesis